MSRPGARDVAAAVAELRAEYRRGLGARLSKIELALARARRPRGVDAEALREAIAEAHRIRGTGGSLGFQAISDAAGRLEDAAELLSAEGATEPDWAPVQAAARDLAATAAAEPQVKA